jgi:nucleoside-diphosphate-sugar epimerase
MKICIVSGSARLIGAEAVKFFTGKQVRDNIRSLDLVNMFWGYYQAPRPGAVYNVGGGRFSDCSMKEAMGLLIHSGCGPTKPAVKNGARSGRSWATSPSAW